MAPAKLALATAALLGLAAAPASAVPDAPVRVNQVTTADQVVAPGGIAPGGGGYVVAFSSNAQGAMGIGGSALFQRRFGADGAPLSDEHAISAPGSSSNDQASVAALPDGRYVIAWSTFDGDTHTALRFFKADGTASTGVLTAGDGSSLSGPSVSMAPDGSAVVAWEVDGDFSDAVARRYAANGTPLTGVVPVSATNKNDREPKVAALPDGGFVAIWQYGVTPSNDDVMVRAFGADGTALGTPTQLAGGDAGSFEGTGAIAAEPDGSILALMSGGDRAAWRHLGSDAAPLAAPVYVLPPSGDELEGYGIGRQDDGTVSIADIVDLDSGSSVETRRFTAAGAPLGDARVADPANTAYLNAPAFAVRPDGATAVAWTRPGPSDNTGDGDQDGAFARFYDGTGGAGSTPPVQTTPTTSTPAPPPPAPVTPVAPAPPPAAPATTKKPTAAASLPAFAKIVTLPSAKRCVSRRHFTIHLKLPKSPKVTRVSVALGKAKPTVRTGSKVTSVIDLRGLPKGRFTVKIALRTADGASRSGSRTYRTCVPKRG